MMMLAIDTATEFAGLALYTEDTVWAEEIWHAARNHTVEVMPRLHHMLQKRSLSVAQLDGIAVSIGPGSYTGVRIAVALAKGLALPHNLPVIGVPTLEIVAYPHRAQTLPVIAVAQAGRKRILTASYGWVNKEWVQVKLPALTTVSALAKTITDPVLISGELKASDVGELNKVSKGNATVATPVDRIRRPAVLAELGLARLDSGEQDDLDSLMPVYLSNP